VGGSGSLAIDDLVANGVPSRALPDVHAARPPHRRRRRRLPSGLLVAALGTLAILGVLELAALRLIERAAEREALDQAGSMTADVAVVVLAPYLTDDLLAGDPQAIAAIDRAGTELVERSRIDHVKVWSADGTVLWSDEEQLIGDRFELEPDELEVFDDLGAVSGISDLTAAENYAEAGTADRLLEVYLGTRTDTGTPVLVETYSPYSLVDERSDALRSTFVPPMTLVLAALAIGQIALVWILGRRLASSERKRSLLLERTIRSSDAERRRVAAEVHDGVVQDLMGISFALAGAAQSEQVAGRDLGALATSTRGAVGALRGLLSSIYPVDVPEGGWISGLDDAVEILREQGTDVVFDVDHEPLSSVEEVLVLRVTREALRNVARHAAATTVLVELTTDSDRLHLTVRDNGVGFDAEHRPDGHLGLRLITDLVTDAGGSVTIRSNPGAGSTVSFEMMRFR
jgi:two-component system, NarL family, sensor kinase